MKKLRAFAAALSLASASFALPSTAAADTTGNGNSGPAAICQALAASFGVSQGNCVASLTSTGGADANAICNFLEFNNPAIFALFPNFGACVSYVNANILGK